MHPKDLATVIVCRLPTARSRTRLRSAPLAARRPEHNAELQAKFTQYSLGTGVLAENIVFLEMDGRSLSNGNELITPLPPPPDVCSRASSPVLCPHSGVLPRVMSLR